MYGIQHKPPDVRIRLLDASQGRSTSTIECFILHFYHYDPQGQGDVLWAMRVMRLGGVVTLILLGSFLMVMCHRERRRCRTESYPHSEPPQRGKRVLSTAQSKGIPQTGYLGNSSGLVTEGLARRIANPQKADAYRY